MGESERLSTAGNVLVPSVLTLRRLGFAVSRSDTPDGEEWRAERGSLVLIANDPVSLLGLHALREERGSEWPADDAEIDRVLSEFYPE
jgi:hypothetical protein